jgi:undecaprenyl phosphate N,N'-diacetylbacillosamine 1-phosphate transferase
MAIARQKRTKRTVRKAPINMYSRFFKRFLDVFISIVLLVLVSPILLVVALVLYYQNKSKVFFFQERPGLHQQAFHIIKFKTMTDEKDADGKLLPDNKRLTAAGKLIRKLSIDELPQLINVLKGDMSLIGPRPLLFKYIPLYSEDQLRRHELRPGITGWAQVNGRNTISWEQKFVFDIYYVENISFMLDIKIILLTGLKVIQKDGINQTEDRPMKPFVGNNQNCEI